MIDIEKFVQFNKKNNALFVRRNHEEIELQFGKTHDKIEENYKEVEESNGQDKQHVQK